MNVGGGGETYKITYLNPIRKIMNTVLNAVVQGNIIGETKRPLNGNKINNNYVRIKY